MRLFLSCLIFSAALSLSAQIPKSPKNAKELTTIDCAKEQYLHSPTTREAETSFVLINRGKDPIKIFWIEREGQGQRKDYNNGQPIKAGETFRGGADRQQTFDGDLWVIADVQGKCLKIFTVDKLNTTIDFQAITTIDVPPPPPIPTRTPKPTPTQTPSPTASPSPLPIRADEWKSQRSKSPFDGPLNQGVPDRLWIWTDKSSTLINNYVDAEIGLANKSGPNCTATSPITFNLICNSCSIEGSKSREFQINAGQRVAKTRIRIESPKVSLSAIAPKLQSDQIPLKGCPVANQVALGASQTSSFGRADGATPVPFGLTFLDDSGQTATNNKEKTILVHTNGPEVVPKTLKAGALMEGSTIKVPSDQCDVELEARSAQVGHFQVDT